MADRHKDANRSRTNLALAGFILIIAFLLVAEHKAHVLQALPYLLLLLCPLMHLLMHGGGHGRHGHDDRQ